MKTFLMTTAAAITLTFASHPAFAGDVYPFNHGVGSVVNGNGISTVGYNSYSTPYGGYGVGYGQSPFHAPRGLGYAAQPGIAVGGCYPAGQGCSTGNCYSNNLGVRTWTPNNVGYNSGLYGSGYYPSPITQPTCNTGRVTPAYRPYVGTGSSFGFGLGLRNW